MRTDQLEKLQQLGEDLTEVVLVEADPSKWPTATLPTNRLSNTQQRARYLAKKNANATLTLLCKVHNLLDTVRRRSPSAPDDDHGDLDRSIHDAEAEAAKILKRVEAQKMLQSMDRFDRYRGRHQE